MSEVKDSIQSDITNRITVPLFSDSFGHDPVVKLKTSVYNKVFSHIYETLNEFYIYPNKNGQPKPIIERRELESLQNKVHAITGDGEVMKLFNDLLGVGSGI